MNTEQGILWDMDGVLVDTGELHFEAWSLVLSEHGIPYSRDLFTATFGMNSANTLSILLGEKPTPEIVAQIAGRKEEIFRQVVPGRVVLLPGVVEWLERLSHWGIRQAIASSAPRENIDLLVGELGLRSHFDAMVSGVDLSGKPDPAVFLEAARQISVLPARCVVIEDSQAGVQAAKRGGMKCIAVTTTNPAKKLSGADIIIDRLDALSQEAFKRLLSPVENRK